MHILVGIPFYTFAMLPYSSWGIKHAVALMSHSRRAPDSLNLIGFLVFGFGVFFNSTEFVSEI